MNGLTAVDDDGYVRPWTYAKHFRHAQADGAWRSSYAELDIDQTVAVPATVEYPHGIMLKTVGRVAVEVCNECLHTVTRCLHTINTWNSDGTVLSCNVCGVDVT